MQFVIDEDIGNPDKKNHGNKGDGCGLPRGAQPQRMQKETQNIVCQGSAQPRASRQKNS